jgi:hypothetical protein
LKKITIVLCLALLNIVGINNASAQEWKRYQEFTVALGNQFAAPMRSIEFPKQSDSFNIMGCTSEPIHPYVVVTAAHCIWGIYGDTASEYFYNGGVIWIQEPGKRADDPSAKRVKVVKVINPESIGNVKSFPVGKVESQDDIAFLVLEKPIVTEVKHKIATLEQIKFAIDNKLKMRVYGYGLNSVAEQDAYYATPENLRYKVSDQLDPRKLEYDFVAEAMPSGYTHHVGFPKMVLARSPICGALGTSGSPAVIEINGEEFLVGPGSHSTGWNCPELKNHDENEARTSIFYKYRNISSHIIIANYPELMKKAISMGDELKQKTEDMAKITESNSVKNEKVSDVTTNIDVPLSVEAIKPATTQQTKTKQTYKIKCKKGKTIVYVTGANPKCAKGYARI